MKKNVTYTIFVGVIQVCLANEFLLILSQTYVRENHSLILLNKSPFKYQNTSMNCPLNKCLRRKETTFIPYTCIQRSEEKNVN